MDQTSGKGISHIPLIMLGLAIYLVYKTFFLDNEGHKVYLINAPTEAAPKKDTVWNKAPIDTTSIATPILPLVVQVAQKPQPAFSDKVASVFSPKTAPPEEIVKNLLDQQEKLAEIAKQTGLKKKEIRKIKRKKKAEERKDKRLRRQLAREKKSAE